MLVLSPEIYPGGNLADRVKMIAGAFAAFSMIMANLKPTPREAVRAVAILLYSGMFRALIYYLSSSDLVARTSER